MTEDNLITWIIVGLLTNLSALIAGIIAWIRSAKMMPKEVKGADLSNRSKEVSIADQFDALATKAAERAVQIQTRLSRIESDYDTLKSEHDKLSTKVFEQEKVIREQELTISNQTCRINMQEKKIEDQDEIIATLRYDLDLAQEYNTKLRLQLTEFNIVPLENPKPKRKTKNGTNGNLSIPCAPPESGDNIVKE